MGNVLVIGVLPLFKKIDKLKSGYLEIDHRESIAENFLKQVKSEENTLALIFLDMKVPSDSGSPVIFIKELGDKKIGVPVYVLTGRYDLEEAEDILMEENAIGYTSYELHDDTAFFSSETEEEIRRVLREAELRAKRKAVAAKDDKKAIGWALQVDPENYDRRRLVSLFIGEMRDFILTLKSIIGDINMRGGKETLPKAPFKKIKAVEQLDDWHRWVVLSESPEMAETREEKKSFEKNRNEYHLFNEIKKEVIKPNIILIRGETGVGKSLAVRLLHRYTAGENKPLKDINCTGIPDTLLESELFGAMAGSYTDRKTTSPGQIIMAYGGTLFLDEIGDMPMSLQAKLLKFFDDSRIHPLGWLGDEGIYVPLSSIIVATNKDLRCLIKKKKFREDLYYRFASEIKIPSLKQRKWDLEKIIDFVLQNPDVNHVVKGKRQVNFIQTEALNKLKSHDFPGNFREMESILKRAIMKARLDWFDTILEDHITFGDEV